MKITLEFDSNNGEELDVVLSILGASPVGKANISANPEDRKDPKAEADAKKVADLAAAKAKTDADTKAKADAAAKTKADADAKAKADADAKTKADADAKAKIDADAAAAAGAGTAETAGDTTTTAEDNDDFLDGPTYTIEDVRGALKAYAAKHDKTKAVKILKDNGAASIGELDVAKYGLVMAAAKVD